MAIHPSKKISELPDLEPASLNTTYIVGISGSNTYKIAINQLTSSLDNVFATDLVVNALSASSGTIPTGTISGSSQLTSSFDIRYSLSGSTKAGTISGSAQITGFGFVSSSTNINTGSLATTGSNTFRGNQNISGSQTITGSFYLNGRKQFNVGSFTSTITQSGSANVSQSISFNTTDISQGVSIVSNSRITLANAGTYNIQFSAQVDRVSGSGTDVVYIWLTKNGVNVSNSATVVTISGAAAAAKVVPAWNFVVDANANDYYELVWQSPDANIQIIKFPATGNIPLIPSVILTVTQVA
jgi:hypothetical protein